MRSIFLVLAVVAIAAAIPRGRKLRPEEKWRPAGPRDLSKYKPRFPTVDSETKEVSWEKHMTHITNNANKLRKTLGIEGLPENRATECGIEGPPSKERIVGGHEAQEHEWPWIVALFIDNAWFCGGSIINEHWVLTAAHCAEDAYHFEILAGAHNVRSSSEPHRVTVDAYGTGMVHEDWDHNTLSNDVALIRLEDPISFNDYIKPACLPTAGDTADVGEVVTPIGWGKPSDSAGGISPVLRMVEDLPIMSNRECNDIYGIVGDGVVCIDTTGGKGTCSGDSGGPLGMRAGSSKSGAGAKWNQVGVVSFGASAGCEVGLPAGFSRTEYYLDWIQSHATKIYH